MTKAKRCIFCKESSHSSKSVEHIIPESFGSKNLVLPKGVVCDKCNNYFSRKIEGPLLSHPSMRNVRAWYQVPTKKGKLPSVKGKIGGTDVDISLRLDSDGKIDIQPEKEKDRILLNQKFKDGQEGKEFAYLFPIDIDPPQWEMSRFMAKMGFEALAFRFLNDLDLLIDEVQYDLIRNFVRIGSNIKEWPFHRRVIFPMETQMVHPKTGDWVQAGFGHILLLTRKKETYFVFLLYGVEFAINLGGPSIEGYNDWLERNNNISPIVEGSGAKLIARTVNGETSHFLEGTFNVNNGIIVEKETY